MNRFISLLILLCCSTSYLSAATYYVNKSGSDSNTCATAQSSTAANGKLTITGASGGISCMTGGDTLIVGDGTYVEYIDDRLPSGSTNVPTILRAANRNQAILQPTASPPNDGVIYIAPTRNWITIDGVVTDQTSVAGKYGYRIGYPGGATHIVFQHGTARNGNGMFSSGIALGDSNGAQVLDMDSHDNGQGADGHGIYVSGTNAIVDGNRFYNNGYYGVQVYNGSGGANGNIIRNNKIYSNNIVTGGTCIILGSGTGNLAYNNICYSNAGGGIEVNYSCTNCAIYNNTIYNNTGWCVNVISGTGTVIKNNICRLNSSGAISDSGTGTTCTNNLNVTSCGTTQGTTDPSFVSVSSGNFHLSSTMSPAVGAATSLVSIFTTDFDNVVRGSSWDQGAYEFVTSGAPFPSKTIFRTLVVR